MVPASPQHLRQIKHFFHSNLKVKEFNLKSSTQSLSAFETVIRFLGGLMGAYRMSGDYVFVEKAIDVAKAIDPGFDQGPLPAGL